MGESQRPFDDYEAIRQFRVSHEERLRREDRWERIGNWAAFVFLWFWISFMSFGVYSALEGYSPEPVSLRDRHDLLVAIGAGLFGGLVTSLWYRSPLWALVTDGGSE
jgi:hypothetical protein